MEQQMYTHRKQYAVTRLSAGKTILHKCNSYIYINVAAGILCTPSVDVRMHISNYIHQCGCCTPSVANLWVQGCLTRVYCDTIGVRVYLW